MSTPPPVELPPGSQRAKLLVEKLLSCLCNQLQAEGRPVCCCGWRRSAETLMPDACDCRCGDGQGVAWIRIVERTFGEDAPVNVARARSFDGGFCGPAGAGEVWSMEAGIARCWPEGENGMSCEEHTEAADWGAWDDEILFRALACCDELDPFGVQLEGIRTLGPEGGCIASVADFTARPVPRRGAGHPSEVPAGVTFSKIPAPRRRGFGR